MQDHQTYGTMHTLKARSPGFWGVIVVSLLASLTAHAQLRVIDEAAIPYAGFLSKADFDQRFPGEVLMDAATIEPGWYVVYQHQSLNYYFGPMQLESTGRDYLAQLRTIVNEVVAQRPSIEDYTLQLQQAPFESAQEAGAESGSESSEASEPSEPSESSETATPEPPSSSFNIWTMVKRLFGM